MIRKLWQRYLTRRAKRAEYAQKFEEAIQQPETYTREQVLSLMEKARAIGYTDGKRDGLAIAREQATKSLREILKSQNQSQ